MKAIKTRNLIDEPSKTAKIKAIELYKKLYFGDVRE